MSVITKEEVAEWIRELIPYLENPSVVAPEGYFEEGIKNEPGKIITYGDCLTPINGFTILEQTENIKALIDLYKIAN